jgi:DNA-binding response OmpR family regulator
MQDMATRPAAAQPAAASTEPIQIVVAADVSAPAGDCVEALSAAGYQVRRCPSARTALRAIYETGADVLLIVGQPADIEAGDLCRRLRAEHCGVPIIVIGDTANEADVVTTLDAGADVYLGIPVRLQELQARVRALRRRLAADVLEVNGVRIEPASGRVWQNGVEIHLSPRLFALLRALMADAGKLVTRERLMAEVWNADPWTSTKTLDMHMSWLRRRLGDDAHNPHLIVTLRSLGFRFNTEEVTNLAQSPRRQRGAAQPLDGSCA